MREPPFTCLFCSGSGPFERVEHLIPESLGNDDTVLPVGFVCDLCNQYFGSKVEAAVLGSPPFNVERAVGAIRTKKGKFAKFESAATSLYSIGFWDHAVFIGQGDWLQNTSDNHGNRILWVDSHPQQRKLFARFFLKLGLELLLLSTVEDPYAAKYSAARECARRGHRADGWEVAYGVYPSRSDLVIAKREDEFGPLETRQIYQYEMGAMSSGDIVLSFTFINHCFACNLSQPSITDYVSEFNARNDFNMLLMR